MAKKKLNINHNVFIVIDESVKIPTNHKCYKCIWANIESGRIFCFRKPCVREAKKNAD